MIDKMRELTDGQMQEFVKVLEKRRVPLHSVLIAQHGKLIFEKYYAPYCLFCNHLLSYNIYFF